MVAAKKQALFLALDNSLCVALSKVIIFISVLPFVIPKESQVVLCPRRKVVHTRHPARRDAFFSKTKSSSFFAHHRSGPEKEPPAAPPLVDVTPWSQTFYRGRKITRC